MIAQAIHDSVVFNSIFIEAKYPNSKNTMITRDTIEYIRFSHSLSGLLSLSTGLRSHALNDNNTTGIKKMSESIPKEIIYTNEHRMKVESNKHPILLFK